MNYLKSLLITAVIFSVATVVFIYSGLFNVAATEQHYPIYHWLLQTTRIKSIEARLDNIQVPDLDDENLQLAGINDFDAMCAVCHTAPGREPSGAAIGLNPPAPDLAELAMEVSAEQLFWVTKNGIRMTGMPAWGASHDDEEIWPVIAFLQVLPDLDSADYEEMLKDAEDMGHHAH
jgi:mono/diheme cytochrome c family protein